VTNEGRDLRPHIDRHQSFAGTATMADGEEATVNLNSPDTSLKTIPVQSSQVPIT
jgi:hypothetical protein